MCITNVRTRKTISSTDENSYFKCKEKCYKHTECVAFSYETPTDPDRYNCVLSKEGKYGRPVKGNGWPNIVCYILGQRGIFT